jgi:U3 small nucleolar RNA-associated protein 18
MHCVPTSRFAHASYGCCMAALQILAIASRETKDAMRLVHVPSFRTFPNWPTSQTPLKYVNDLAFSPNSGYIASGNDKGQVLLYSLTHYTAS